jgi:coproporphyrinogen III oxidase
VNQFQSKSNAPGMIEEFTKLYKRMEKAEVWLNAPERTRAEKEKYYPEFKRIVDRLGYLDFRLSERR